MNADNSIYAQLILAISQIWQKGQSQVYRVIHHIQVETYWQIGRYIVEYEQHGQEKAEYGTYLLDRLARDLTANLGRGFSRTNISLIRKLYLFYPTVQTLSEQLSWSHYCELLGIEDVLERSFYEQQTLHEKWSIRELKRQKKSALFQRLALSRDKEGILRLAREGNKISSPEDIMRDPYVLEFLNIPEEIRYSETDLEDHLITHLQQLLLELGKGFAFIGRQYRITLANRHHYVDLVFYHRILKCFVLIDLKIQEVEHGDIGQMNLYLNYFHREENMPDDNAPVGIILSAHKDDILVEYALGGITNQIFVSRYQLYLPDKALLQTHIRKILEQNPR